MKKRASQQPTLEHKVARWETRFEEHKIKTKDISGTLAELVVGPSPSPVAESAPDDHPKKPISYKRSDVELTKLCIDIANDHIAKTHSSKGVFQSASFVGDQLPEDPALPPQRLQFHSNARPLSEFDLRWHRARTEEISKQNAVKLISESDVPAPDTPAIFKITQPLPENLLEGNTVRAKLESLFVESRRYYNKAHKDAEKGDSTAIEMPVDSRWHIRRLLVLHRPERPFTKCLNERFGICHAQKTLRHPAAPDLAMIAYYNEKDYLQLCRGVPLPSNVACNEDGSKALGYENFCEFCYRVSINLMVEESKHNNHRVSAELCNRYYAVGAGEYSQEGMFQQAEKGKVRFSHGIFGPMRIFNIADFLPAMLRFSASNDTVLEILHYDEYQRRQRAGTLQHPDAWIPGWEEAGPFFQPNENAFSEVKQLDPYTRVFASTAREYTVSTILEDYFARQTQSRPTLRLDYGHLFWPLLECWADPTYLQRPHHRSKRAIWKRFCLHPYDAPPDPETHRLYYIILMKINTLRRLISSRKTVHYFTKHIIQKIQVYLVSYHALLDHMAQTLALSDVELMICTQPVPRLNIAVSPLLTHYPLPVHHHRHLDYQVVRLGVTVRRRNDPLTICQLFYTDAAVLHRDKPEQTLYSLPNAYNRTVTFEPLVDKHGPTRAVELFEPHILALRESFQENLAAIGARGSKFVWKDPALKKHRRQFSEQASNDTPKEVEKQALRQRRATLKALRAADETIYNNFHQIDAWVSKCTERYNALLAAYGPHVLCDFNETVVWLEQLAPTAVNELVLKFHCFASVVPAQDGQRRRSIELTEQTVNGVVWQRHIVLLALLLRVVVLEELHELEPAVRANLRYNLVLLRNSHLKLFRKIAEKPTALLHDNQLRMHQVGRLSLLELYYPCPTRELHQGCLPNYTNSLEMVNFFTDCGMDHLPWSKLHYKMPDRCCDVREFSEMLRNFCQDPTLYRWMLLVLRLSLGGLYEHCTVVPSFARSLSLDELFDNATHAGMKPLLMQFVLNNESLVVNALSESLCYQIELLPALQHVLRELYRDWFAWRVYANMDMIRHIFSTTGTFAAVKPVVFVRVNLKSMRTIFRVSENDFVTWLCAMFKKSDEDRYKHNKPRIPHSAKLKPIELSVIQNLIYQFGPDEVVDVRLLAVIGLEPATLDFLHVLYNNFLLRRYKNLGREPPKSTTTALLTLPRLIELIQELPPKQCLLLYQYFRLLRNYQSVRVIKLNNAAVLRQQQQRILEKPIVQELGRVPKYAFCCAFSLCCLHVKNSWSLKAGAPSTGFEDVIYSMEDDLYTCAKHAHRFTGGTLSEADAEAGNSKLKRKSDRELRKPDCSATEIFTVPLLGVVVEADACKIPGAKRAHSNKEAKAHGRNPPIPGYWITTCCGIPSEWDESRCTPAGYCCQSCIGGIALYNSFQQRLCTCCRRAVDANYHLIKIFDDCFVWGYRRILLCAGCFNIGKRVLGTHPLLSFVFAYIKDPLNSGELLGLVGHA